MQTFVIEGQHEHTSLSKGEQSMILLTDGDICFFFLDFFLCFFLTVLSILI